MIEVLLHREIFIEQNFFKAKFEKLLIQCLTQDSSIVSCLVLVGGGGGSGPLPYKKFYLWKSEIL